LNPTGLAALRQRAPFSTSNPDVPGVFLGGRYRASGSFDSFVEKGTEYELEFEDEYDSGTIARSQRLFFARSRFVGINRVVEF
jgi:hypothetical protein